jgi:metallo-beta-lactamase family protein
MKITFLGAARTVTGSCYLVETEKTTFLVDCGMHQGQLNEEERNRASFPFRMDDIDFVLLTHAHIDHSGRLPKLYVEGFRKSIYATKATADLCGIMLPDSGHIQEMESEWQDRKGKRAGRQTEKPMYTMQDGIDTCGLFRTVTYGREFSPSEDLRIVYRDAGHILGSAIIEIVSTEEGKEHRTVFSGDLGNKGIPIMRDPTVIAGADTLIVESTYGDRLHVDTSDKVDRFVSILNATIARGGNVVIPSFAVGRTQELIYELNREEGKYKGQRTALLHTPVYVDSPMATNATRVFRENTDCYDDEARSYIENGDNPLDFPNLHFTASAEESKQINLDKESKIIISSSGMCDAGRIKHHLKHNLWRRDSSVIFVGYQARGTLGRSLVDGAKSVRIFGEEIAVNARIEVIEGYSGHADRDGLLDWIGAMKTVPGDIILVHGEPEVIERFGRSIADRFGVSTRIPDFGDTLTVGTQVPASRLSVPEASTAIASGSAGSSRLIDDLRSTIDGATERIRTQLMNAKSGEQRTAILEQLRQEIRQRIDESFERNIGSGTGNSSSPPVLR